jgi:hypothetical protein
VVGRSVGRSGAASSERPDRDGRGASNRTVAYLRGLAELALFGHVCPLVVVGHSET